MSAAIATKPAVVPTELAVTIEQRLSLYRRGVTREHGFEDLEVDGVLPSDLCGTLYRNGPGITEQHGRATAHPFEADGAVSAVCFDGIGGARGALRITESAGLREERRRGRILYGSNASWPRRVWNNLTGRVKNTANTSVMVHQGKLFGLMEAARPTEIDRRDLKTIGETDLDGVLGAAFSAHPHRVASRRATYNFGIAYGKNSALELYEMPDAGPVRKLARVPLDFAPMVHDFIATERALVFFVSPVAVRVLRLMSGLGGFDDFFGWRPEKGTEVVVVPIDAPNNIRRFHVEPFFQWHFANAFDVSNNEIIVDYVRYANFDSFEGLSTGADYDAGVLHRARIDLDAGSLVSEPIANFECEFPRVNPRCEGSRHRFVWTMTADDRGLARVDTELGTIDGFRFSGAQLTSEPVFVNRKSRSDEKEGYALALCFDLSAARSYIAIFDAADLAAGPRTKVWFKDLLPQTFHGVWAAA